MVLSGLACSNDPTGPGGPAADPITRLPRELTVEEQNLLGASNAFAFDLAEELLSAKPGENPFVSPLSASMLLGMILNGVDGDTHREMRRVLGLDGTSQEEINRGYRDLVDLLVTLDPSVTVETGNSLWIDRGFSVLPDFLERVRSSFDAEAREESSPRRPPGRSGWIVPSCSCSGSA